MASSRDVSVFIILTLSTIGKRGPLDLSYLYQLAEIFKNFGLRKIMDASTNIKRRMTIGKILYELGK